MVVWLGLRAASRCWSGMWTFLTARTHCRSALELERERQRGMTRLERERNHGTAQAIALLPPGAELLETDLTGRLRIIRIPQPGAVTAPLAERPGQGTAGELIE
jgi:hypothetical protein